MNSEQLTEILARDPWTNQYFQGVYALNELPSDLCYEGIYILNTDKWPNPGIHWTAVFHQMENMKTCHFFDPLGQPPKDEIVPILQKNVDYVLYNDLIIQNPFSSMCGQLCATAAMLCARGWSMMDILLKFFVNPEQYLFLNDAAAYAYLSEHFQPLNKADEGAALL